VRDVTVSVIMAVHNGEPFLREAIESILGQSFADLEFIIANDGSTDGTPSILADYARSDARVVLIENSTNIGLTRSLNRCLEPARGRYIARQDADDVSLPQRLAAQMDYLEAHPDIGLLGTAYTEIDPAGRPGAVRRLPPNDTGIRWRMLFHNPFCHSTVVFRRGLLIPHPAAGGRASFPPSASGLNPRTPVAGYDLSLPCAQDYELWSRLLQRTRAANLPEPLIKHRVHNASISATRLDEQTRICSRVSARQIAQLAAGLPLSPAEVDRLRTWTAAFSERLWPEDLPLGRKFLQILVAFEAAEGLDREVVARIVSCWHERVRAAVGEHAWLEMAGGPLCCNGS
jgi:hypothetical protein